MLESMVSLERRSPTLPRLWCPWREGFVCTLGGWPDPVAWSGVSMAERSIPGCGGRRVECVPAAITGRVAMRWQREACGAGGGVRRSGPVCGPRRRCEESET